ncbi:HAD family hydrolase [Flammeovirga kamogawensis]|uniref:Haloacid dehalogenase-like hydrolase n=1 Tax=Flammeovirga kamogawensis TaxID=373891 RepID=A0ABX8GWL5_9BACT|nr:HAD family hydrolase [Flammeovirga kamogawensis]MBB6461146.1 phosphoserine phosphatase [Flammeovirga kamogawensis]QWG07712.1 haloacid dehalogenase-like hydrolase [Flammeovirga kamogawensis]TRX69519.1 haloacid dehalogenase-like hydrolase [Flammeovirga kamogawensis]
MKRYFILLLLLSNTLFGQEKTAVFNLDGTIISESNGYMYEEFTDVYSNHSFETYNDLVHEIGEISQRENYQKLVDRFFKKNDVDVYEDAIEIIKKLKAEGYTLVLCTSTEEHFAKEINKRFLNGAFDKVIGSDLTKGVNSYDKKVSELRKHNIHPDVAYGNSLSDFPMMNYAEKGVLVVNDDDERNKYKDYEECVDDAKENGFEIIHFDDDTVEEED